MNGFATKGQTRKSNLTRQDRFSVNRGDLLAGWTVHTLISIQIGYCGFIFTRGIPYFVDFVGTVSWGLTTVPIYFGVDISLKCMANGSSDCFGSGIFKWIGGPEKEVISFDLRVFDRTKYLVFHDKGDYLLVIKNVTARDLDISYACHCGFYNFTSILKNVSILHFDDKVDGDQRNKFMVNTPEVNKDKGKTENVSIIVGSCVGAITCVLVISIGYAIYKRRNRDRNVEGSNDTNNANHEKHMFLKKNYSKKSNKDIEI